jgi:hypothetical protein
VAEAGGAEVAAGATGAAVGLTVAGAGMAGWPKVKVNLLELVPRDVLTWTESVCV